MLLPRILLCLALFMPLAGLAQGSDEAPVPSEPGALPPPPLLSAPEGPEAEPPEGELFPHELESAQPPGRDFSVARGMFELIGGGMTGAGVGFLSLLLGAAVFLPTCDGEECIIPIYLTGIAGVTFGVPLGVWGAGKLLDGRGKYWPTLLGTVVGAGLGILATVAAQNDAATILGLTAGPVIGAIVGYELSHAYSQPTVFPTVSRSLTGGIVAGLSGRF